MWTRGAEINWAPWCWCCVVIATRMCIGKAWVAPTKVCCIVILWEIVMLAADVGLDRVNGVWWTASRAACWSPLSKVKSLRFATKVAIVILRIDDFIKLKPREAVVVLGVDEGS
jgi:hypothetical protein